MAEAPTVQQDLASLKQELIAGAAQVASIGLVPLTQGNLSIRDVRSGLILMTPHDYPYDQLKTNDVVVLDLAGNVIDGHREPSHESQVHLAVYERRPRRVGYRACRADLHQSVRRTAHANCAFARRHAD